MPQKSFRELINKNLYQVFLFTCRAGLPFSLSSHPWFVCSKKGELSRWEILFRKNQCPTCWGHLHLNYLPPASGIEVSPITLKIMPFLSKPHWQGEIVGRFEGGDNSTTPKMIEFIENSPDTYPFCNKYSFFGPNSNTYAEWVIRHFPESNFKLPKNSFGRYYVHKIA